MKEMNHIYGGKHLTKTSKNRNKFRFDSTMKKFSIAEKGCVSTGRKKRQDRINRNNENESDKGSNNNFVWKFFFPSGPSLKHN